MPSLSTVPFPFSPFPNSPSLIERLFIRPDSCEFSKVEVVGNSTSGQNGPTLARPAGREEKGVLVGSYWLPSSTLKAYPEPGSTGFQPVTEQPGSTGFQPVCHRTARMAVLRPRWLCYGQDGCATSRQEIGVARRPAIRAKKVTGRLPLPPRWPTLMADPAVPQRGRPRERNARPLSLTLLWRNRIQAADGRRPRRS